jgi:NADPH:quinone reductase-like Zn-dependent oxidoreductase
MMMKALQLVREEAGTPPVLSLVTVQKPKIVPGYVLVRIYAAAIHPSDRMNVSGAFLYTTFPRIPGRDFSGVIEEGPVNMIGEEVYGTSGNLLGFSQDGTYAQYCLVPQDAVARKPHNLSFAQAARVGVPFTTAAIALRRAATLPSDTVLVLGAAGTVGSAAVQLAKGMGCQVITASRHDNEDINTSNDPELEKISVLTHGHGVEVVVDTVGDPHLLKAALVRLALRGRLSFISAPRSGSTDFTFDLLAVYRKELELIGCNSLTYSPAESAEIMGAMTEKFESGILSGTEENALTKFSLEEAVEVFKTAVARKSEQMVIIME